MDFDERVDVVKEFLRDYVFSFIAILTSPWNYDGFETANQRLASSASATRQYAIASAMLGGAAFAMGGVDRLLALQSASVVAVVTLWVWVISGLIAHLMVRLFGGTGQFGDTLGVCIRVLSTAYAASGLITLLVWLGFRTGFADYGRAIALGYGLAEFVALAVYVPAILGRVHYLGTRARIMLGVFVPLLVLTVTMVAILVVASATAALGRPATATAQGQSGVAQPTGSTA